MMKRAGVSTMRTLYLVLAMMVVFPLTSQANKRCNLTEEEALELVTDAYIYAFPIVLMNATRENLTNVAYPEGQYTTKPKAPVNQLGHAMVFPDASFTDVVGVNTDTLNTRAYLDLSDEPMILHIPAMDDSPIGAGKRYYVIPLHDPWTNVYFTIGSRTTGTEAQTYAFVGPNWHGRLPKGVTRIQSPADVTFLISRIYCAGGDDVAKVNVLQEQMDLRPLSTYCNPAYEPPPGDVDPDIDSVTPPIQKVMTMNATTFFETFSKLLKATPPPREDLSMLLKLNRAGFIRGVHKIREFDMDRLDPMVASVLDAGVVAAQIKIRQLSLSAPIVNGWMISNSEPYHTGSYGTDYLFRAFINMIGYGAALTEDALYPASYMDSSGNGLINLKNYKVHFEPGQLPPVNPAAFWSLTVYNRNRLLVDEINFSDPTDRTHYTVHHVDVLEDHFNEDGSLDIYITPYAEKETAVPEGALWLPSPTPGNERFQVLGSQGLPAAPDTAPFTLGLRLYWADPEAYNGGWIPPLIEPY